MQKRRLLIIAVLGMAALLLAACGGAAGGGEAEEACPHKIGFVTDVGKLNDQSFNESGWNGVIAGAEALGLGEDCYSFIETADSADYIPNIQSFVDEGFDIVVTSGFAMTDATREAGAENPDVFLIGTDQFQEDTIDNVAGLIFHEDVSGYLAGVVAGLVTESNVVGGVYGCPSIPPVVRFEMGYYNGVKYANPDAEILNVYHPGSLDVCFVDPEWGAETASTLMEEGADVLFGAGGLTGNGALIAGCNEDKIVIGVDFDQYVSLPEVQSCIITSATKGLVDGVADLIVAADAGEFTGGNVYGDAVLAPYHDLEDMITPEMQATIDEAIAGIKAGEIDPCAPFEGAQFPDGAFCSPVE